MNRRVPIVMVALFLLGNSATSFAGLTFKMVTSGGDADSEMQIWVDNGSMKSQILRSPAPNPLMPPGSYMLMTEQGMFLVNPQARSFARFDMGMLAGMTRAMSDSGMANAFEITNVRVEKTLDEPGESIGGYATRHFQFKSSWTMAITGSPMTTEIGTVEDLWVTNQIELPAGAGMAFDQSALPASVKELVDAQGLKDIGGFPLRTVTRQTTKSNMGIAGLGGKLAQRMMTRATAGAGGDSTTTVQATDIREIDIPAGTFDVPAGFSETQLFQTGPDVPNLNNLPGGPALPNLN